MNWQTQKICADAGEYELIIEKQKTNWQCEQTLESWKWSVIYHGSVIASGSNNSLEEAKKKAQANTPSST